MPGTDTTFPPAAPTIDGSLVTVDLLLKSPVVLEKRINNLLLERLIADFIFAKGQDAPGGAVIYDRVLTSDLYTSRDVQEIEPGSEFPIVDDEERFPETARTVKRGGMIYVTYEARRRNNRDVVAKKLTRLTNTMARKIDTVAMAVLDTDPAVRSLDGTNWNDPASGDPVDDIMEITSDVDNLDLGYKIDTVLINPKQELALFRRKDIREALPRENPSANPLLTGRINGFLGLNWLVSNRVPQGSAYVMQRQAAGSMHDELALYTRVIDQPLEEAVYVQAARVSVPVVTDPLSVVRLTGLNQ